MLKYFWFIFNFTTCFVQSCGTEFGHVNTGGRLVVSPSGHIVDKGPPIIVQRVDDALNLTCRLVKENEPHLPMYNISWNWQYSQKNNANRVMMVSLAHNEANLVFKALKETDSGEYTCKCTELGLCEYVWIKVKPIKRMCSEKMFVCSNGDCIGRNFVCDGKEDCKYGTDEDPEYCGLNPCQGKIPCDNGRCIPTSWCCDEQQDINCTTKHKPKCCQQLVRYVDTPDYVQHPFGDMGFLQTTIYTVIGCAMAFMLIVTILVIAICRVHLKRTVISRCPLNHHHHHHHQSSSPLRNGLPLYDLDMFLDRQPDAPAGGLLVTYNINNGVQFVGRPIDPPPYSEIIDVPPREGPPPPYVSREHVTTPNEPSPSISNDVVAHNPPQTTAHNLKTLQRTTTQSLIELSKPTPITINSYEFCTSVPSVSGTVHNTNHKHIKKHDTSDSDDTDSVCMEHDALLHQQQTKQTDDMATASSSAANCFMKTFIGTFKMNRPRPLLTQKSFDSTSERTCFNNNNKTLANGGGTHSLGDLSPVNVDDLSYGREILTLPLRESHIGVRND